MNGKLFTLIFGIILVISNVRSQTTGKNEYLTLVTAGNGSVTLDYVDDQSFKITIKVKMEFF